MENIQSEGHTHSSTGQGIQPINGIRKDKLDSLQGLVSGLKKVAVRSLFKLPFINKEITAKKVNIVSKETNIFDKLSKALYLPNINIKPHITKTIIDKSIGGKFENNGIFVKRTPETKLTAAIVKVPVTKLIIRKIGRYKEFLFLKPSKSVIPVDAVKRVPTSKNGYFRKFVMSLRTINENPNLAPAVVDDIR